MSDDELIDAMATAWTKADGNSRVAMRAVLAVVREHDAAALAAKEDFAEQCWLPGIPPKHYGEEWFIAETIHGDRVVLKALPEEYAYDYKTADDTYFMAKNIKRWMQFPDSEYKSAALAAKDAEIAERNAYIKISNATVLRLTKEVERAEQEAAGLRAPKPGLVGGLVAVSSDPRYAGWVFVKHADGINWTTGARLSPETWAMIEQAARAGGGE